MDKTLKIAFMAVIAVAVILSFVLRQNSGSVATAGQILEHMADNDLTAAYAQLSPAMKATTTEQDLSRFVDHNDMLDSSIGEWRVLDSNAAREVLASEVTTSNGNKQPVVAVTSQYKNDWKLDAMMVPQDLAADILRARTPDIPQLQKLVGESVQVFAQSLKAGDIEPFYQSTARLWRNQTSVAELRQAFDDFFKARLDLTVLADIDPVIDNVPVQDKKGVIMVSGYYPTRPSRLHFEEKFIWEGLGWKPVSFTADIR